MAREKELIRKTEAGDEEALSELIQMYYSEILRYCRFHTPGMEEAQDAVQETFLKVVRYLKTQRFKGNFRPYLYKIALYTCIDMSRKRRGKDMPLEEESGEAVYEETGFARTEADMQMQALIGRLDTSSQEILLLRFGQELTMREISEITGTPMRTVQSRLRAALKQIEKEVGER